MVEVGLELSAPSASQHIAPDLRHLDNTANDRLHVRIVANGAIRGIMKHAGV